MDVAGINGVGGSGSVSGGSVSGMDAMSQQQQHKMLMDYLGVMNGGPGTQGVPGQHQQQQQQAGQIQDFLAANNQLMESMLAGGSSANGGDAFNTATASASGLMNASAMLASPGGSVGGAFPGGPGGFMPMMNSAFHKEFMKQIANVQKEQGSGPSMPVQAKRPVGRPPGRPPGSGMANREVIMAPRVREGGSTRFACDYCHKTFASRYYLATHIQVHLAQLSPAERKEQLRVISSPEQLRLLERAEEKLKYTQQGPKINGGAVGGLVESAVSDRPTFHCQKCNKTYRYEGAFESHRCLGKIDDLHSPLSQNGLDTNGHHHLHHNTAPLPDLKRLPSSSSGFPPRIPLTNGGLERRSLVNDSNNNQNSNNTNINKPNKCGLCPCTFSTTAALQDHLRNHHKIATAHTLPCQHCDMHFNTIAELVQHQEELHVGMEAKGDLICAVCNSAFKNLDTYFNHMKSHTDLFPSSASVDGGDSGASFEDNPLDRLELELNNEEESDLTRFFAEEDGAESRPWKFTCEACGGKFMRQEVYHYHVLLHRGERPYSCRECAKAFKARPVLLLHETCHRESVPVLGADEVGRMSGSAEGYLPGGGPVGSGHHMMAATAALLDSFGNNNGMTYQCTICDQIYDNKTALREHEMLHMVDGEYTCKVCGKKFRSLIGLKIHNNKHQNDLIQMHLNASKKRDGVAGVGGVNGEAGAGGPGLLYYEEVDGMDKERPFVCRVCDKRFKTKHALPYHMLLHTGETPFGCDFCGKGFRALISLKLHAKKHEDKGWNPNFDHMEHVQRQYQQQVLSMGETRSVTSGKPPTIRDVIPFAKAVQLAAQLNVSSVMGGRGMGGHGGMSGRGGMNGEMMEDELNRSGGSRSNGGAGGSGAGAGDEQDEPNIHDFCAVEMMMEPEIEINEFEQSNGGNKVSRGEGENGEGGEDDEDENDNGNGVDGSQDGSGVGDHHLMNGSFNNGSQYAHLLPDEDDDDNGEMMMKNEARSDDENEHYGNGGQGEDGEEDQDDDDEDDQMGENGNQHPQMMMNGGDLSQHQGNNGLVMNSMAMARERQREELLQRAMQPQSLDINSFLKYECPICFKRFKNRLSLPYHLMTHERGDPVNCNYCNRKFVSKMKLRRHLRMKHDVVDPSLGEDENEEPKPAVSRFGKFKFACPTCNRKFKSKFTLKLHMKHHHLGRPRLIRPPGRPPKNANYGSQMEVLANFMPKIEKVESMQYAEGGGSASALLQSLTGGGDPLAAASLPMTSVPTENIPNLGEIPTQSTATPSAGQEDAQFDCDHCDQKFVTFAEYKLHMKFHLEEIATASAAAVQSSGMRATMVGTGMKAKVRYDMQNSYRLSKEYEHLRTKDGRYQCNICHKLFKCRQSLPYHMNLHKKNSIFRCLMCKTGFRNLHGFKMHNHIYHKTRELPAAEPTEPQLNHVIEAAAAAAAAAKAELERVAGGEGDAGEQVKVKQEFNSSAEMDGEEEELDEMESCSSAKRQRMTGDGEENSLGSSVTNPRMSVNDDTSRPHQSGDDLMQNGSVKEENNLEGDLSMASALNQTMSEQMMNNPFGLFPPALLHLQQMQQLQLQMQQQMGASSGNGSAGTAAATGDNDDESKPLGVAPDMLPIELETGERGYMCSLCKKICRSKQASIYHRMIHTGEKPYKCHICDKRCRSQANLELHKKMHVNELRAVGQLMDGNVLDGLSGPVRRRKRFHSGVGLENGGNGVENGAGMLDESGVAMGNGLGMLSMMMGGGGSGGGGGGSLSGDSTPADHTMTRWRAFADMKRLRCLQCSYKFKSVQALTYHCMIHTGEKPYQCKVCNNSFRSKTNLNLHERSHQRASIDGGGGGVVGNGSYQEPQYDDNMEITLETLQNCPEVANGFLNATNGGVAAMAGSSSQQRNSIGGGNGGHVSPTNCFCLVCEKTFRTEGYVRHHQLLVHTVRSDVNVYDLPTLIASQDGYMFKCDLCNNCFRTKQYYYFHLNTHHAVNGEGGQRV